MKNSLKLAGCLLLLAGTAWADDCKVIVNSGNATSTIDREKVTRLFLKKQTKWDSGEAVLPVDQVDGASKDTFSRQMLDKSPAAVKSFWQQQIFSGRDVPPPQKQTDQEVIEFVKSRPGAVGYVSAQANTDGVKVLKVEGAKP